MTPFDECEELARYRSLFRNSRDGYVLTNGQGRIIDANPAFCAMLDLTLDELASLDGLGALLGSDRRKTDGSGMAANVPSGMGGDCCENVITRKDGSAFPVDLTTFSVSDDGGPAVYRWTMVSDITEKKRVDVYRTLSARIYGILNESSDFKTACDDIAKSVIEITGCAAAGIRLKHGDDFPYYSHHGFSRDFITHESRLALRSPDGGVCRDANGDILLECTCGLILAGKTDPSNPLFTPGGSCWTNHSFPLLHTKAEDDPRLNPRNRCIHEGFASVAIVPIRAGQKIVGLLQINDRRKDRFSLHAIQILESIAAHIGGALMRKEAEWRFHELFRKSGNGIAVYQAVNGGQDFVFKDINTAGEKVSCVKREDILGRSLRDVFPAVEEFGLLAALRRVWETGRHESLPLSLYKDHRIANYVKNEIFKLPSGEVVAVYEDLTEKKKAEDDLALACFELERRVEERTRELSEANESLVREIDERKKSESRLRRSQALLSAIAEGTSDSVFVKDIRSMYLMINSAGAAVIGKTPQEIVGKMDADLFPEEVARLLVDADRLILESGETRTIEEVVAVKGKDPRTYLSTKGPIRDEAGLISGMFGISKDITERAMLEKEKEKIAARQRKIQKAESLRRMAAAIAHKFNNMMGVVIGNIELALDDGNSGDERDGFMEEAKTAARKAADVSGLMLTYLGQITGPQEIMDLTQTCRTVLDLLPFPLPETMPIITDLTVDETLITANAYQIQQAVIHLVANARESYSNGTGTIMLRLKTVARDDIPQVNRFPADWQPQDVEYICLEVSDTGCGIAEEYFENLFDPFYTSKFTGRGLGLPVVLGIVSAHRGAVTVDSEVGRGSTFRLFLPRCKGGAVKPAERRAPFAGFAGNRSVLLVEDETHLRSLTADMLTRMGFSVFQARDGMEALELFKLNHASIDCVFSDLAMPGMDGWTTLSEIRKINPEVPVVLTSGYDQGTVMDGHQAEMPDEFIRKPYHMKEVLEAIGLAFEKKRRHT